MTSAAKRKYVSKSNQEELLKSFYDNLGNDDDAFLGHKFVLQEEEGFESDTSSISDESYGGIEQAVAPDVADEPAVALVVDEPAVAYVANELAVALVADEPLVADVPAVDPLTDEPVVAPVFVPAEGLADEPDQDQEPPKKQKFRNLDAVLDESNYKHLPSHQKCTFKYSDAKKTMQLNWQTVPNEANLRQCYATNILRYIPGPRGVAKRLQTPLESFKLFFTNEMVDMIVRYTNCCIQPILQRVAPVY